MRVRRAAAPLSALAALTLLLAGCAGSEDASGAPDDAHQESPLSKYFSAVYGGELSPEEQEERFAEEQRRTEELVAECMQAEGFEYTPATGSGGYYVSDGSEWRPDDREWVAQYGYGAVKSPFSEEPPPPEEEYLDPNAEYVASLSEPEQMAFYEALHGPMPTEEEMAEGGGEFEYDWTTAGCQGAAQHKVAGEDPSQSEEFRPLFDAINELYTDMASWPGMAELDAAWAACVDDAGHGGHADPMEAQTSIHDAMNALYEEGGMSEDGSMESGPDQVDMDALAEREIELALADLECREETDYRDRSAEITREVEEQFIEDHKAELDALVAAAEQN
ncbi:hypothetical protein [Blastococcus saxobsidens]|uniref:Uncharacterized protein n=1 Tax=Blastococcus saxobsidens TaxID=138336 RepID=A0A4Q7Y2S1_9ACTN|nr:hypothetical protein [Blastococcus saxobsidens]RZU30674.1 hypothetical protein BKA19_0296 [Blastococcus saxobsidens]